MAVGRKQKTTESDWLDCIQNIEETVSKSALDDLIKKTVNDIQAKTSGLKTAFSWSGGKDSIVLAMVCELAGINNCLFVRSDLEYTQFCAWVDEHKPANCEVINTHQNLLWLSEHQDMLFPQDAATAAKWFKIVQHKGQESYYRAHNLDMILLGRRKADGNYVGKGSNIYTNAKGITRFSPLADWTHEDIIACIHYYHLDLPPIYGWKNGYLCGTHSWPARQYTGSIMSGWQEVYDIEPSIVLQASQFIESAGEFLNGKTEKKPD